MFQVRYLQDFGSRTWGDPPQAEVDLDVIEEYLQEHSAEVQQGASVQCGDKEEPSIVGEENKPRMGGHGSTMSSVLLQDVWAFLGAFATSYGTDGAYLRK